MLLHVISKESLKFRTIQTPWIRTFKILTTTAVAVATKTTTTTGLNQKQKREQQQFTLKCNYNSNCKLKRSRSYITTSRKSSVFSISNLCKKIQSKMNDPKRAGAFVGVTDRFNGVTVVSEAEYEENMDFEQKLKKSLAFWSKHNKRAIWFQVSTPQSDWIPILVKHGFDFHYAKTGFVMLKRWLPEDESVNLPDYAHTLIGVGGLVVNHEKMEVLVITDRFAMIPGSWKLPGGYVDPTENLVVAAKREVKEETGVDTEFRTMVSLRHSHGGGFGCSDMYFVVALTPLNLELRPCEREIARACWMPVSEYLSHPNVHETNRHFMRTYLDYERRGVKIDCVEATHQILKKKYLLYHDRPLDEEEKLHVPTELELVAEAAGPCSKK